MKLTAAQQKVMDHATGRIDFARTHSFEEWFHKGFPGWDFDRTNGDPYYEKRFDEEKAGITLVTCNSRTLYKLRDMGLIEIIRDTSGSHFNVDEIRVLNY